MFKLTGIPIKYKKQAHKRGWWIFK